MNIIIYGSQYGTAEQYAKELSKIIKFKIKSYKKVDNIDDFDTIIYIWALYAGGVLGMKKTFKGLLNSNNKKLLLQP